MAHSGGLLVQHGSKVGFDRVGQELLPPSFLKAPGSAVCHIVSRSLWLVEFSCAGRGDLLSVQENSRTIFGMLLGLGLKGINKLVYFFE